MLEKTTEKITLKKVIAGSIIRVFIALLCFAIIALGSILYLSTVYKNAIKNDVAKNNERIPFGATMHQGKPVEYDIVGSEGDATIVKARTREPGEKTGATKDATPKEIAPETLIGSWSMPSEAERKADCYLGMEFKSKDELLVRRKTGKKYVWPTKGGNYFVEWQGKTAFETYKYKIRDMRPSPDGNMQVGIMELCHVETQEISIDDPTTINTIKGSGELTYQCVFGIAKEDPRYMCIAFFGPNEKVSYDMPEQDKVYTLKKVY